MALTGKGDFPFRSTRINRRGLTKRQAWGDQSTAIATALNDFFFEAAAGGGVTATPVGVSGTGVVGTVTISTGATMTASGVSGAGSVGTVTVSFSVTVSPTGVSGIGAVGAVTATGGALVLAQGVYAAGLVGTVAVEDGSPPPVVAPITGGAPRRRRPIRQHVIADPAGVASRCELGRPLVFATRSEAVQVRGEGSSALCGSVRVRGDATVRVRGVAGRFCATPPSVRTSKNLSDEELIILLIP